MTPTFATVNDLIGALCTYPDNLPVYGEGYTLCAMAEEPWGDALYISSRDNTIFKPPTVAVLKQQLSLYDRRCPIRLNGKPITDVMQCRDQNGPFVDLWAKG